MEMLLGPELVFQKETSDKNTSEKTTQTVTMHAYFQSMTLSSRNIWGDLSQYDEDTLRQCGENFNFGIPDFYFPPIEQVRHLGRVMECIYELIDAVDLISVEDNIEFATIWDFTDHLNHRLLDENARPPFMEPEPHTPPIKRSIMRRRHKLMLEFIGDFSSSDESEDYDALEARYDDVDPFFLDLSDDLQQED